jgi:hypothetical protein
MYAYLVKVHKINSSFEYLVSKLFQQMIVKFIICILTDACKNSDLYIYIYIYIYICTFMQNACKDNEQQSLCILYFRKFLKVEYVIVFTRIVVSAIPF